MEKQNSLNDASVESSFSTSTKKPIPHWTLVIIAMAAIATGLFFIVRMDRKVSQKELLRAPQEKQNSLLQKLVRGQYSDGREEGERLLRQYPGDPFILKNTATAYYNSGINPRNPPLLLRAEELFRRYLTIEPADFTSLRMLVRTKNALMKRRESITLLEKTAQKFPEQASALYFDLGILYDLTGSKREARRYYEFVLKSDPRHAGVHILLSRLAVGTIDTPTDIAAMRAHAQKAIELSPAPHQQKNRALAYAFLAESYHHEDNIAKGLENAQKSVSINPVCAGCVHVLGEVLIEKYRKSGVRADQKDLARGIAALEESLDLEPLLSHAYISLGIGYWLKGEFIHARKTWKKGLQILPQDPNYPDWYKPVIKKELEEALANPQAFSL